MIKSTMKSSLYYNALINCIEKNLEKEYTKDFYKKIVFYGIKSFVKISKETYAKTYQETKTELQLLLCIKDSISKLTPSEFIKIFPVSKEYDGNRWECKDYFYTMDYIKTIGTDKPIGDNVDEFLWEYVNNEVRLFNVSTFSIIDNMRRFQGKSSMMEEFANMNDIKTYSLYKDQNGKEYFLDRQNGKTLKISRRKANHLRIIK